MMFCLFDLIVSTYERTSYDIRSYCVYTIFLFDFSVSEVSFKSLKVPFTTGMPLYVSVPLSGGDASSY